MLVNDTLLRARPKPTSTHTTLLITPIPTVILSIAPQRCINTPAVLAMEIVRPALLIVHTERDGLIAAVTTVVDTITGDTARHAAVVLATETARWTGHLLAEGVFLVRVVGTVVLAIADEETVDAVAVVATETVVGAGVAAVGLVGAVCAVGVTVAAPFPEREGKYVRIAVGIVK